MKRILFCVLLAAAALGCQAAGAEEEKIPTVKFALRPAAEPQPALKYQLLPGFLDRKPGNAAVTYNKTMLEFVQRQNRDKDIQERLVKWAEMPLDQPLDQLPRDEVEKTLKSFKDILDSVDRAARRETCDWEMPVHEVNPITMLIPEIQETRALARLLAAQARLQIAKGEYGKAVHTLQTGFALARHAAEGPTLVNALVGMAICGIMSEQLEVLIQQPDSPNLYWALATLPQPIISVHKAAEVERHTVDLILPELRTIDETPRDAEYWRAFVDRMVNGLWWEGASAKPKAGYRPIMTLLAIKGYPDARRALLEQGHSAEKIDAMPVAQVVAWYSVQTYHDLRDRFFKWFELPYWQARPGIEKAEKYMITEGRFREIVPIASLLLPAVGGVKTAEARTDRKIALLRTLEALRMYAAGHEGQLPARLEDVTEVPIPIDPMTGKSFVYEGHGKTAVLEAPIAPGADSSSAKRYEIEVK